MRDTSDGELRYYLAKQGTLIGPNDLLIAAHTIAADLTLITANIEEFERVPGLRVENGCSNDVTAEPAQAGSRACS